MEDIFLYGIYFYIQVCNKKDDTFTTTKINDFGKKKVRAIVVLHRGIVLVELYQFPNYFFLHLLETLYIKDYL